MTLRKTLLIMLFFMAFNPLFAQQTGYACIYSKGLCGDRTASGERLNCSKLTAAHKTLKLGTKVKVTNLENDRSVIVRINDRGPYSKRFILDLSPAAAKAIGLTYAKGKAKIRIDRLDADNKVVPEAAEEQPEKGY